MTVDVPRHDDFAGAFRSVFLCSMIVRRNKVVSVDCSVALDVAVDLRQETIGRLFFYERRRWTVVFIGDLLP